MSGWTGCRPTGAGRSGLQQSMACACTCCQLCQLGRPGSYKWLTFPQIVNLYSGCEATAKAVCNEKVKAKLTRPHPEPPTCEEATQYYVLEFQAGEEKDTLEENIQGTLRASADKDTFSAMIENASFATQNVGKGQGMGGKKPKKVKTEEELTASEKAQKTLRQLGGKTKESRSQFEEPTSQLAQTCASTGVLKKN